MRELHVVALSEDGRHLVLATRAGVATGEFRVALDERLSAAVRGELPAPGRDAPASISPRDIQSRLRDGESPEDIAASAGVPLSRVERYAGPVLAELDRMVTGARAAVVSRPRLGPSAVPLGAAVEAHLAELAHVAEGSVRWSARRTDLGRWVVEVSWTARGRRRTAGWRYDPVAREVTAVDGPSAVLGHVEAGAPAAAGGGQATRSDAAAAGRSGARAGGASRSTAPTGGAGRSAGRTSAAAAPPTSRPAAAPSTGARSPAAARTAPASRGGQGVAAQAAPVASGPPQTRRAAPRTPPAGATATAAERRRSATAADRAAQGAVPATSASGAGGAGRRAPARRTPSASQPVPAKAPLPGTAPRRPAARRSAVPSLDELAGAAPGLADDTTTTTTTTTATTASAPATPPPPPAAPAPEPVPPRPPVLRVVPPADPEPAPTPDADAAPAPERQPARRAAGSRAGGRDWADVLMGAAPSPPAGPQPD